MKKSNLIYFIIIFLEFILLLIYGNKVILITKYDIYSDKINSDIVIAQISDLHNCNFDKILYKRLKYINPDIIVITGDLIDSNRTDIDLALKYLNEMKSVAPIFYVSGNHEGWAEESYNVLKEKMDDMDINILEGESREININENKITIMGIDDPVINDAKTQLNNLHYNSDNFVLLLSHRPELFNLYQNRKIDLVLAGHAHGGQVRIPLIGGLVAPNQGFFPTYSEGLFESNDDTKMIVSRGIGNSIIPLRINNPPEIVVVTLKAKK